MTAVLVDGEAMEGWEARLRSEPRQAVEDRVAKLRVGDLVAKGVGVVTAIATGYVNLYVTPNTVAGRVEGLLGPVAIGMSLAMIEFCPTYPTRKSKAALCVLFLATGLGFALSYSHFLELLEADSLGAYLGAASPDVLAGVALFKSLEMRSQGARDRAELERRATAAERARTEAAEQAQAKAEEHQRARELAESEARCAEAAARRADRLATAWAERANAKAAAAAEEKAVETRQRRASREMSAKIKAAGTKIEQAKAFLESNPGAETAAVLKGLGWESTESNSKTVYRARKALEDAASAADETSSLGLRAVGS